MIRFLSARRFSFVDLLVIGLATEALMEGRWIIWLAILVIGMTASVVLESWQESSSGGENVIELQALRKRVKAQRAELRRLNKVDALMWAGWRWGCDTARHNEHRAKLIRAFGLDAVMAAESHDIDKSGGPETNKERSV
jgi:hypothetical protein